MGKISQAMKIVPEAAEALGKRAADISEATGTAAKKLKRTNSGGAGGKKPASTAPTGQPARKTPKRGTYSRPSGYRKGVRDQVWDNAAKNSPDGQVRDPTTNQAMSKDKPWDMGHRPGYEFRKHQKSAEERGIDRKQFLDEHNAPSHYRPELPEVNSSHRGEDHTDDYFGP